MQKKDTRKIIYLADDDQDDRILFLDAVEELDLPVIVNVFEDGLQVLKKLSAAMSSLPEIIFLDINMPGRNGFECLEEIRNLPAPLRDLKIIMLSTSNTPENINLCYTLGADFYAVKPSTFQELKELLGSILKIDWGTLVRNKSEFLLF